MSCLLHRLFNNLIDLWFEKIFKFPYSGVQDQIYPICILIVFLRWFNLSDPGYARRNVNRLPIVFKDLKHGRLNYKPRVDHHLGGAEVILPDGLPVELLQKVSAWHALVAFGHGPCGGKEVGLHPEHRGLWVLSLQLLHQRPQRAVLVRHQELVHVSHEHIARRVRMFL